ncbi:putative UDP-glucose/GDP-mannose dehydrogenase family, central domain protein [Pavlovales sp. CCMP2436]|nr:putative UDP-glucose/GDP-mannose dehydrogenase family, central domain protein [Pavlovales sp. CCMP2436]
MAQMPTCIAVIGAGHVGGPTAVMIAHKCPGIKVLVTDANPLKLAKWQGSLPPVYEPGLKEILEGVRGQNLFFEPDLAKCIREAQLIFVAVTTPLKQDGVGAGHAPDVRYWEAVARTIGAVATEQKVVIERSTVPVRTAMVMARLLRPPTSKVRHEVLSNPSFAVAGTAMVNLASPDVVLIGGQDSVTGKAAVAALTAVYAQWVPAHKIKASGVWSAELSKLAASAFLAQRVSSMSAISAVCEASDADVGEVARAIGTDSRIGAKHLQAGIGFGGACYPTHLRNLIYLCQSNRLPEVATYWQAVLDMNTWQRERFTESIVKTLFNTVAGKKIAVLGFAYKKDTSDIRESPAKYICRRLLDEGAELSIYDPAVSRASIEAALGASAGQQDVNDDELAAVEPRTPQGAVPGNFSRAPPKLSVEPDAYSACVGAHAFLLLTDWDEFKALDYSQVYASMKCLDNKMLREVGFNVHAIGSTAPKAGASTMPAGMSSAEAKGPLKLELSPPGPLDY